MSSALPAIAFHRGDGCAASIDLTALSRAFAALAPHFPRPLARVDVLLVGDEAMDAAHRRYMNIAGTTDVMSFPAHDEADAQAAVEADLIVCVDVAARERDVLGRVRVSHPVPRVAAAVQEARLLGDVVEDLWHVRRLAELGLAHEHLGPVRVQTSA